MLLKEIGDFRNPQELADPLLRNSHRPNLRGTLAASGDRHRVLTLDPQTATLRALFGKT